MTNIFFRHIYTFVLGIATFFIENILNIRANDFNTLMSSVLTLAATLTAIFIGFVSIILSLGADRVFKKLNLDLSYLETLMLGTLLYLLVSFEAIVGFFIKENQMKMFMNIWFSTIVMALSITLSLLFELFYFLHGKWKRRKDDKDIY